MAGATLPKAEKLCGKAAVEAVFTQGKSGLCGCLRYRWIRRADEGASRILVSVPKRSFKRAVKRNLLKRRIRESYRLQKDLLGPGVDILFVYVPREVLPSESIFADMTSVLRAIRGGRFSQVLDNQSSDDLSCV